MNRRLFAILGVVLIAVMVGGVMLLNDQPRDNASPPTDAPTQSAPTVVTTLPTDTLIPNTPTPTTVLPLPVNALPTEEMLPNLVATNDLGGDQGCIVGCDSIDPPPSPPDQ